jgi:type I restriction enzyme M protein
MTTVSYSIPRSKKGPSDPNAWIFDLRDSLRRSPIPTSDHTLAVSLAAMIILRWVDFQDAEGEAMAAFDGSDYRAVLPASLHWRSWCDHFGTDTPRGLFESEIPSIVRQASHASANPLLPLLARNLPAIQELARLEAGAFIRLSEWLAKQPFETFSDRLRLLSGFDAFLNECGSRETGQMRTPSTVCDLLVALADLRPGEKIYDPCFGFGGILTTASAAVSKTESHFQTRLQEVPLEISGVEVNSSAYTIGLARLILAGAENPNLEWGNSLERPSPENPKKDGFDVVLCDGPWGQRVDLPGLEHFPVPTNDSTALFLQHSIGQLKPGGRCVIVIPKGSIFRQQRFAALRQWLFKTCHLETVITLPDGVFRPYSGIGASVLVLRKEPASGAKTRIINSGVLFPKPCSKKPVVLTGDVIKALVAEAKAEVPGEHAIDLSADELEQFDEDAKAAQSAEANLQEALALLGKGVPIVAIKDFCRVTTGRSISAKDLLDAPDAEDPIPYIRIANIQHGQTTKATSWVSAAKAAEIGPRYRLRAGEILVSKAGTIGKTGVVRNGAVGGIASQGLFVLSPDSSRIDSSYLHAYLQALPCQEWLISMTNGAVVRGLRKEFLEEFPVPLPPLPLQEQVAQAAREHGEDPIRTLATLLPPADANPLSLWIEACLKALETNTDEEDPSKVVRFKVFGSAMYPATVDNKRISEIPALQQWANAMFEADPVFRDSEKVPRGSALYGIFQAGIAALRAARALIPGNSLLENRALKLTDLCLEKLDKAAFSLCDTESINCQITTDKLTEGELNLISCTIRNRGFVALRDISVSLDGFEGGYSGFLAENTEIPCTFVGTPEKGVFKLTTKLKCFWTTLNGLPAWRESEIEFTVQPAKNETTAGKKEDIGSSPYFVSEPVGPQRREMFIGREEILEQIQRQLTSGNTVLLEGNRRAGKTSILKQIEGVGNITGKLAVYSSMQASEGDRHLTGMPSEAVWRRLANDLAKGLASTGCDVPLPDGSFLPGGKGVGIARACRKGISAEAPWEDFLEYAGVIVDLLAKQGLGLVLMIDEFDKLQEGIDNGITSPQIPENIRYLIQNLPGFSAILTGSRRMQRLRHEYWSALYGLGSRVGVTALAPGAAERLVRQPVEGKLSYSPEAVQRLTALCAWQPFLIQSLANLVFVAAAASGVHAITVSMVDDAAQRFVKDNEHFASLMDYTESDLRRFLVMLIHQAEKDPDPITLGTLQQKLGREGILTTDNHLTGDLRFLIDLELIDFHGQKGGGGSYSLSVPLMGQWLDYQHDFHALLARARAELEKNL